MVRRCWSMLPPVRMGAAEDTGTPTAGASPMMPAAVESVQGSRAGAALSHLAQPPPSTAAVGRTSGTRHGTSGAHRRRRTDVGVGGGAPPAGHRVVTQLLGHLQRPAHVHQLREAASTPAGAAVGSQGTDKPAGGKQAVASSGGPSGLGRPVEGRAHMVPALLSVDAGNGVGLGGVAAQTLRIAVHAPRVVPGDGPWWQVEGRHSGGRAGRRHRCVAQRRCRRVAGRCRRGRWPHYAQLLSSPACLTRVGGAGEVVAGEGAGRGEVEGGKVVGVERHRFGRPPLPVHLHLRWELQWRACAWDLWCRTPAASAQVGRRLQQRRTSITVTTSRGAPVLKPAPQG